MSELELRDFRAAGHRIIDLIADYWRDLEGHRVAPPVDQATLFARFAGTLPDIGIGLQRGVDELSEVLDASIAMSHPLYLGLVNSSPLPEAVLGDLVVSALDNNGGASHQGPANAAAEREVVNWLARRLQYAGEGMILPGGSHATLQALQIAKFCRFPAWLADGPTAMTTRPRLYVSGATHFSSARAAKVIGLGDACIAAIPGSGRGEMDPQFLQSQIEEDIQRGWTPFAVIATAGSTGTGAMDPLDRIAPLCRDYSVWLHVDACYGGAAALLDSQRALFDGLQQADSLAVDLHKWFFMPLTAGVLLTRHEDSARALFDVSASYIPDAGHTQAYCRGLPTSRRASGLAAWFGLRTAGWQVIEEAITRNIVLTRNLEQQLQQRGFRVLPGGVLSIACARWEPAGFSPAALDRLQESISDVIRRDGEAWFATTLCDNQVWLRFNMVNLHSQQQHVDRLAELVTQVAQRLAGADPTR